MIKVLIPDNFLPEREYIAETIISELLGLECIIQTGDTTKDYTIELPNGKRLIFIDSFFSNHNEAEGYLKISSLPSEVFFAKNDFLTEDNIPVIYGNNRLEISEGTITCGIDIFASAFFMLTRWEEYVLNDRDTHNRFPGESSLAYKFDFLNRPVVNEYMEMLWKMILKLGADEGLRKSKRFVIVPTHDIDRVYYNNQYEKLLGDILIDFKPQNAVKRIYYDLKRENMYDTFDWLMDISERKGLQSRFYFLSDGKPKADKGFLLKDKFITELTGKINSRGHLTGYHLGYDTYNNAEEWLRQKNKLEEILDLNVNEGRQHYLRMDVPDTLQIWEDNGMTIDSTLGYSSQAGFRCGTADEFTLFNVRTRNKLTLKERPLIYMDETFRIRSKPAESLENARKAIEHFKEECRKYKMPMTILFHNNNFEPLRWKGWKEFYEHDVMN
jgi:hypothetical protein